MLHEQLCQTPKSSVLNLMITMTPSEDCQCARACKTTLLINSQPQAEFDAHQDTVRDARKAWLCQYQVGDRPCAACTAFETAINGLEPMNLCRLLTELPRSNTTSNCKQATGLLITATPQWLCRTIRLLKQPLLEALQYDSYTDEFTD
ncbi:hypothetical protein KAB08_02468 [Acinetobacter baumannii]|nr:hypothetical protein KAB08_02468 [Acinetobacter baumannii]